MTSTRLALAALLTAAPALADEAVERFDAYARTVGPLCALAPSTDCFEAAFTGADRDGDDTLSLTEVLTLRTELELWLPARAELLTPGEQAYVRLGLQIVDLVGIEPLFVSYDADGDGGLDRAELAADVSLDERPLGDVIQDADAVDWPALQARLGVLAGAVLPGRP